MSRRLRAKYAVFSADLASIFNFVLFDDPLCDAARNFMISRRDLTKRRVRDLEQQRTSSV